jgi:beta-glucosidase
MYQKPEYQKLKSPRPLEIILIIMLLFNAGLAQIYLDSTATVEERVNDLLGRMTLDEKIGQMVQVEYPVLSAAQDIQSYGLGSLLAAANDGPGDKTAQEWADLYDQFQSYAMQTRLGIPLLFALDAVHGFGAVYGATVFPHNIGMGCTRNPQLVAQAAQVTAQEMAATGIDWVLGPVVAVARNENWGRTYESYAENPDLVAEMTAAVVPGFQGDTPLAKIDILACAKHYIGDGGTTGGVNAGDTQVDEQTLRAIHLPGYLAAIEQNVGSIMVSQSTWNGAPCHGHYYLLTTLLKEELGFEGLVISDYNSFLLAGGTYRAAISKSINAGLDMAMVSTYATYTYRTFIDTLRTLANQEIITQDRIDDAVKRILTQKFRMGLFEHPYAQRYLLDQVGSAEHRAVARECVRQSLVVLKKKDGVLPIPKNVKRIHMSGRHADNLGYQCGGWTITWQGSSGDITIGTTIMEAIQQAAPAAEITYSENGYGAADADIGIAVIGELPYAEVAGDGRLNLDPMDIECVRNLKSCGIPVIVILVSGRPMIINSLLHQCDALIAAWLPGSEGQGISDVLFGDYQPTGLLSQTWPRDLAQIPINIGDTSYNPLFAYGYGITSLEDSPPGSPPEIYSASTSVFGQSIEISFNKKMISPTGFPAGFSVTLNNETPLTITGLTLDTDDSATIVLTLEDSLQKTANYAISYTAGNVQADDGGQLAAFENYPVYNLLHDYKYIHLIPNKIEAELYYNQFGLANKTCTDQGGGKCLSSIDDGNWADYYVNVAQSGLYTVEYRVSSATDTGQIQLWTGGTAVSTLTLPVTGSFNTWQTVSTTVQLSAGDQILRMQAVQGGFQLNWMQFSQGTAVENQSASLNKFYLYQNYPNPFNPLTTIEFSIAQHSPVRVQIFNILGELVATLLDQPLPRGDYKTTWNASGFASGIYICRLEAGQELLVKKLILIR